MEKDLISIIIPVYNGEEYIDRCLESVLSQSYENIEIIIIDDGSTDNTGKICDAYEKNNSNILTIHKKNGGLSTARNEGVKHCSGKYVGFVDADDWIAKDMYEYLHCIIVEKNCDVAEVSLELSYQQSHESKSCSDEIRSFFGKEILEEYLLTVLKTGDYSFCTCLFNRMIFKGYNFREGRINTDLDDKYRALSKAQKYVKSDCVKYFYFQNPNSLTRAGLKKRDFDIFIAANNLLALTQKENAKLKKLAKMKQARSYFSLLAKIAYFGFFDMDLDQKKIIKELTRKLRENYFILMKAPISFNRKLMITCLCLNYRLLKYPLVAYRTISGR